MKRYLLCLLILLAVLAAVAARVPAADKGNPNPGVLPLTAKPGGLAYADWGDAGWKWLMSIPLATNPLGDLTGDWAYLGQPGGPVFLLANTWFVPGESNIPERWIAVGRDQALLLPLTGAISWLADDCMGEDGTCAAGLGGDDLVEALRSGAHDCMDHATGLYATVDGRPLQDLFGYRFWSSQPFECSYSEDSLVAGLTGPGGTVGNDAGEFPVAVADGYHLILSPLSKGEHTVSFGSTWSNPALELECTAGVIYHITVR